MSSVKQVTKELVASTPSQRNWRGILIALLVIMGVCGLILCSIVLLMPPDDGPRYSGQKVQLRDLITLQLAPHTFNGSWVTDKEFVYGDESGGLSVFNALTLEYRVLMGNATFRRLNAHKFLVSSDLKYVMIIHDVTKVFRHTFLAKYTAYEIPTEKSYRLSPWPLVSLEDEQPLLQMAAWVPETNGVVFAYQNDLYYLPHVKDHAAHRLTSTGVPGLFFNGIPDWLYEEEILSSHQAVWFSPDGQMLLYASFNDSLVGELKYAWYGSLIDNMPYPEIRSLRYPKAGTTNPTVTLWAVNLSDVSNLKPVDLKPPLGVKDQDHYFTAAKWLSNREVSVVWMNRKQNVSIVTVCVGDIWNCPEFHRSQVSHGWVDMYEPPIFSQNKSSCLLRLPVLDGDAGHFKQVNLVQREAYGSGKDTFTINPITQGRFEVTEILGWDEERHLIYYMAAPEGEPGQRHLYRVWDLNSNRSRQSECVTCESGSVGVNGETSVGGGSGESAGGSTGCLYNVVLLSSSYEHFIRDCRGPEVPFTSLHNLTDGADGQAGTFLMYLNNNTALRDAVDQLALPQVKNYKVQVNGGVAQVRLLYPPGFRDYDNMKFPLVLQVYGGPGSQLVSSKWRLDWNSYLTSHRNFIVAQIDGRGSGFQGDRMLHHIYYNLGSVEVEDQIAVTKYLCDHFDFIDRENVAVWGWSYGGYVAAMIMAEDEKVFKCGISVAPVTKWELYDSAYTERYMGYPNATDNYRGYENADVTRRAGNLKDRLFLLVHGTADDNVHYQQSVMFGKALVQEGVIFRHQAYPDENHRLSGVKIHLYKAMEAFLNDCFGPVDFEEWELANMFGLRH